MYIAKIMSSLSSGVIGLILAYFLKIGGIHKVRTHMASASMPIGIIANIGYDAIREITTTTKIIKNIPDSRAVRASSPLFILSLFRYLSYGQKLS